MVKLYGHTEVERMAAERDRLKDINAGLLAALQNILEIIDDGELYDAPLGEDPPFGRMKDIAERAIAKAEGSGI